MKFNILLGMFICIFAFQNCAPTHQESPTDSVQNQSASLAAQYFKKSQKIIVKVYYEPGAEPFVGTTNSGMPYWKILEDNLKSIFQYRSRIPTIVVPQQLSDMISIPAQNKSSWLGTELLALNKNYHQSESNDTESVFHVYFLKGQFDSGSGPQASIIGVSIGGTSVLGIFKDVVKSTGSNPAGPVPKYVEQSTVVHEMGHALGFVNNGVPMVTPYQDTQHGNHSDNPNCVMYWQNEGLTDLTAFVQKIIASGSTVLWGPEVLSDAKNFSE